MRQSRARGCLLGQLAGDALGGLVEFQTPERIRAAYPGGVRELADGGTWHTIAGQPTDDSELALLLARMLVERGHYDPGEACKAYVFWLNSEPFDMGLTVSGALRGHPNPESQSNGALMRVSPLGIFGSRHGLERVAEWARQDAAITHAHPVCQQASALYAMAIAHAIRTGCAPAELYRQVVSWAGGMRADPSLTDAVASAQSAPPADYVSQQGWVLVALGNALWQLLHAPSLEEGVVDTVMRGGDTDTNAAICGALLGAVHGAEAVPAQWVNCLLNCRPAEGDPRVRHPRPACFWPVDALELADRLAGVEA
jgi:ADP-ribosylglycohydrolase